MGTAAAELRALEPVTNDGATSVAYTEPYVATVEIEGATALLFHRWSVEGVEEKARAAKGSKAKKSDDLESYVYRLPNGHLGLPGEYLRQSIVHAAKFEQDPRSPRKSAMDLFKAGVTSLTELADLGAKAWDFVDQRRVMVQRNGITRRRPALNPGWKATFELLVGLPEYVSPQLLNDTIGKAGRLIGVGDFRPTYGRFTVTHFVTK
jgi:hypothetical protein